ncbi:ribonuclease III family protein [Cupriavidus basilensis]
MRLHNERLEFLGDSIAELRRRRHALRHVPASSTKAISSRVRANLVKQQALYEIAQMLQLPDALRLGEGELKSGGFRRPSILADALEAIFGAVFLDARLRGARTLIRKLYIPILEQVDPRTLGKDAKTLLQEYLQGHKIALPQCTRWSPHMARRIISSSRSSAPMPEAWNAGVR